MKILRKDWKILEFEVLENRSMAENDPMNLIKATQPDDDTVKRIFEQVGKQNFIDFVNLVLDENE